jgi:hypothetical protein
MFAGQNIESSGSNALQVINPPKQSGIKDFVHIVLASHKKSYAKTVHPGFSKVCIRLSTVLY